jgi:dihydrofolate reductase
MQMGKVSTGFSMSLDGFIALPNNEIGPLFDWMFMGETSVVAPLGESEMELKVSSQSADMLSEATNTAGALVTGRTLFDFTGGWGGRHPLDVPIVVVTHNAATVAEEWRKEGSIFTFVTDGVEGAIATAQEIAGEKNVVIASANVLQQCIRARLVDEIHIDLVPVLLGEGIRMFDHLGAEHVKLEIASVVEAPGVTHLTYNVVK